MARPLRRHRRRLAGLVFVAISINIERILALKGVPERGLETFLTRRSPIGVFPRG